MSSLLPARSRIGSNLSDVKLINRAVIFRTIREMGPISRADLAKSSRLNPATVTHIVRELFEQGIVEEVGFGESRGGRRSSLLRISAQHGYIISISLERVNMRGKVVDLDLREIASRTMNSTPLLQPQFITVTVLIEFIQELIQESGVERQKIIGIGISAPGPLDAHQGVLTAPPNFPGWLKTPLRQIIEEKLGIATFLDNDANVCAMAEMWLGAAKDLNSFVYILGDSGIGSGLIINGEIFRGAHNVAGEIGHTSIDFNGLVCGCGNRGCLEQYASPLVAGNIARHLLKDGRNSRMVELAQGKLEHITFQEVLLAAQMNDETAIEVMDSMGRALGTGIVNICNSFDPEAIIIGGRIALAGDLLLQPACELFYRHARFFQTKEIRLMLGELENAPLIGAACLILHELFENPAISFSGSSFGPLPLHLSN